MIRTLLAAALLAAPAAAQTVRDCDTWEAGARNLVWETPPLTFDGGAYRIALLDTGGEPACCSYHLLVLFPDPDGFQSCALVSDTDSLGFGEIAISRAGHDREGGLRLAVPVGRWDGERMSEAVIRIGVDAAAAAVTAR